MAKNLQIRDNTYNAVPGLKVPIAGTNEEAWFPDTSDATLNSGNQMLAGVTGYGAEGTKITGSIENKGANDLTASGATVSVPAGNYQQAVSKSVASGSVTSPATISGTSASVSTGTNTLTLTKTVSVTPSVTTAGYVSAGTAGNASVSLTASVTTKAAATITPGTTDQEIAASTYLTGKQTIKGDSNLTSANIVAGKSIFNVNGSAQIPIISQDSTTHILSIS